MYSLEPILEWLSLAYSFVSPPRIRSLVSLMEAITITHEPSVMCIYIYIYVYIYKYIYIYMQIYIYMHMYMYACLYTYI